MKNFKIEWVSGGKRYKESYSSSLANAIKLADKHGWSEGWQDPLKPHTATIYVRLVPFGWDSRRPKWEKAATVTSNKIAVVDYETMGVFKAAKEKLLNATKEMDAIRELMGVQVERVTK